MLPMNKEDFEYFLSYLNGSGIQVQGDYSQG